MEPFYRDNWATIYYKDCQVMDELEDESIDLMVTDPPYGLSFMGKNWDKAVPSISIWRECLRVLKPGAFAFIMCIPRQDCLARMIVNLQDAGFETNFTSLYWCYASGFPKAQNIGKAVDKKLGIEREVIGKAEHPTSSDRSGDKSPFQYESHLGSSYNITVPATPQAKALDGAYGGFQPKPAVEMIIVAMKPLSEKTYVDQALENRKGVSWLDDGRIPVSAGDRHKYGVDGDEQSHTGESGVYGNFERVGYEQNNQGRFPANLLVSNDMLNDGKVTKSIGGKSGHTGAYSGGYKEEYYGDMTPGLGDSGSFSRYFDLDKWFEGLLDKLKSKAYNKEENIGDTQWEVSQAEERNGLKSNPISVNGVVGSSPIMPVIEPTNTTFVQEPVMPILGLADQSLNVKSAGEKLSYTETDTAQRLAQIKHDTETLLETITKDNEIPIGRKQLSLINQSIVSYVISKLTDLRDIIQISINQPRLFGSVVPVIIKQMQQGLNQDQLWQNFWQERINLLPKTQQRTFPFAIISKASKSEKNKGCEGLGLKAKCAIDKMGGEKCTMKTGSGNARNVHYLNNHPTVKPLKLISYLITLGSRASDIVLDPFVGSGTTCLAAKLLNRRSIGYEIDEGYCKIAAARQSQMVLDLKEQD